MQIRLHLRDFYPIDGKQLSDVIRFERAKGRCEACGRPRYKPGQRPGPAHEGRVATAHLDHDPINTPPGNLKALCQRCHMLHDREEHRHQRWPTLRARWALDDLFLGSYRTGKLAKYVNLRHTQG